MIDKHEKKFLELIGVYVEDIVSTRMTEAREALRGKSALVEQLQAECLKDKKRLCDVERKVSHYEGALEVIKGKSGSHTVLAGAVDDLTDPGFAGIYATAKKVLKDCGAPWTCPCGYINIGPICTTCGQPQKE